jgi:OPT family oligopeptide transporter
MHPQLSDGGRRLPSSNDTHLETSTGSTAIPLSQLPPTSQHRPAPHKESDDAPDSDSNSALLRQHLRDSDSDNDVAAPTDADTSQNIDPMRIFSGLMSKSPLLLRTSPGFGTGSYGAVPIGASTENSAEEDNSDVRPKNKKKTRQSGLRNAVGSNTGSGSRTNRSNTAISSQTGTTRRLSSNGQTTDQAPSSNADGREVIEDLGLEQGFSVGVLPIPIDAEYVVAGGGKSKLPKPLEDAEQADTEDDVSSDEDEDPPDNSPYPQVRASVSAVDNTTLSINTPRMWTLSMLFAILGSSTNLFFSLRYPSVSITPVIALLLVHPLGLLWDQLFKRDSDPDEEFVDGVKTSSNNNIDYRINRGDDTSLSEGATRLKPASLTHRFRLYLAQGRWNEKEHSCVYISSNVSFGFAFATDVIVEQTHFYNQKVTITYQLLLILSTQILGYTFAGLARRFLVRPGGMIWPGTLMSAAMFTTLHKEQNAVANGWTISRWRLFFVVWLSAFLFYFLPGLLMPALSYFSVITWFAPKNVIIANLFGVASGLGMFPVTFDWAQIAYIGSPLLTPFWAAMNVVGGLVIVMWIIAPIAYYKDVFSSSYMPILSSSVFDNTGKIYNVNKILTPDFLFDREAYRNYSRVFLPITYVLSYGLQFAALASLMTHTTCWHGKDIWRQWKRSLQEVGEESKPTYRAIPTIPGRAARGSSTSNGSNRLRLERSDSHLENIISQEDVHNRLMRRYKDTPLSWYLVTLVSMTAVGIFVVE